MRAYLFTKHSTGDKKKHETFNVPEQVLLDWSQQWFLIKADNSWVLQFPAGDCWQENIDPAFKFTLPFYQSRQRNSSNLGTAMIKARISTKHSFGEKKEPSSLSELAEWLPVGAGSWIYILVDKDTLCIPLIDNGSYDNPELFHYTLGGCYNHFPSGTVITMVQE